MNKSKLTAFLYRHIYLWLALTLLSLGWVAFPPQVYANVDEHNYWQNAYSLSHGEDLVHSEPWQNLGGFARPAGGYISKYNLGSSALWSLFSSSRFVAFAANLAAVWGVVLFCYLIILRRQWPRWWILLIGGNPILIYYSRTLLSENWSALLLTVSIYLNQLWHQRLPSLEKLPRWQLWSLALAQGVVLGLLVWVRYSYLIWSILLLGLSLFHPGKYLRRPRVFLSGVILVGTLSVLLLGLGVANHHFYGSPLTSGYKLSGEETLNFSLLWQRLPSYLLLLNLIYPAQLLLSAVSANRIPAALSWKLFFLFNILFYSISGGYLVQGELVDGIVGVRFFLPLLPFGVLLMLHTLDNWRQHLPQLSAWWSGRIRQLTLLLLVGILAVASLVLSAYHQDFLQTRLAPQELIAPFVAEKVLFVGEQDDFLHMGKHLYGNWNTETTGYLDWQYFLAHESEISAEFVKIYLLDINYTSRSDSQGVNYQELLATGRANGTLRLEATLSNQYLYSLNRL